MGDTIALCTRILLATQIFIAREWTMEGPAELEALEGADRRKT